MAAKQGFMVIGFDAKRAFSNRSGLGNYSRNLIRILSEYNPDIQSVLFAPKAESSLFIPSEKHRVVCPSGLKAASGSLWRSFFLSSELNRQKIQLYHGLSHELPFGIDRTGIPSVVTMHDLIFMRYPEFYRATDRLLYQWKFRYAAKQATRIIAISEQTRNDLIEFLGVDEEKIQVIYQSCFPTFYQKREASELEGVSIKYGLPKEFSLTVGNVEARKNLKNILLGMAWGKIDLPLVVVGKPAAAYPEVQGIIQKYALESRVHFVPNLDFPDLPAFYQLALFSIYPSFFEGFGLPVLESQASGCPVICSQVSSMPEAGGEGARYIDPNSPESIAEAMMEFAGNRDLRMTYRQKGYENAARFGEPDIAKQLTKLYAETIVAI